MTEEVLSVERAGRGKALIKLASGSFIVPAAKAPMAGSLVTPAELQELQILSAKDTACRYLTGAERSTGQLERKLLSRGFDRDTSASVVRWADEQGFVDDLRFCSIFISSRTMGKAGLRRELIRRGAASEAVEKALGTISDTDALDELTRKIASLYGRLEDREKARRRASGWLARRGYPSSVIAEVLREAL